MQEEGGSLIQPLKAAWVPPPPQLPPDPNLVNINPSHLIASDWGKLGDSSIEKKSFRVFVKGHGRRWAGRPLGEGLPLA